MDWLEDSDLKDTGGYCVSEYRDGFEFLKALKERTQKETAGFSKFSEYLNQKAKKLGIPLNGQFELTPLCNFRCGMCYVRLSEAQMCQKVLTPEQWKDLISQAVEAGMLSATLSGGECLAYPGFREVYEHLHHLGCEVDVFTNGALLDEDWIRYFKEHPPAGIQITLYGDSEDAYERVTGQRAFEKVLGHIRRIREEQLPLQICVTPCRELGEDVFGTIRLARELCRNVRINQLLTVPREETGRDRNFTDADEDLYIRIQKFQHELDGVHLATCPADRLPAEGGPDPDRVLHGVLCGGGRSGVDVNWKGVMYPCNELNGICAYPLETGFAKAWRQIREAVDRWPRSSACEGCAYESVCIKCVGQIAAFSEPGTWPHALCERTKRFVQQGVYPMPDCE